mgnify:CR=1 FL=1
MLVLVVLPQFAACSPFPDQAELVGKPCVAGFDLGATDDFSAFALVWDLLDGSYAVKVRFWVPEGAVTRYPNRPYDVWRRAGVLEVTTAYPFTTDFELVQRAIEADCRQWGVKEIAYDSRMATQMGMALEGAGFVMVNTPQGFALNEAVRLVMKLITDGQLRHGHNPILSWMAGNVVTREGIKGDIRIDKQHAPEKIDGFSALVTAFDRIVRKPTEPPSVYETRGFATVGG